MNTILLAYNFEGAELKALKTLCARKSVRLRRVIPEEYAQPVGAFCGVEKRVEKAAEDGPRPGKMLVFAGFGEKQLDMFLTELKTARVGGGAMKAVLTPANAKWDSYALFTELAKERNAIG